MRTLATRLGVAAGGAASRGSTTYSYRVRCALARVAMSALLLQQGAAPLGPPQLVNVAPDVLLHCHLECSCHRLTQCLLALRVLRMSQADADAPAVVTLQLLPAGRAQGDQQQHLHDEPHG